MLGSVRSRVWEWEPNKARTLGNAELGGGDAGYGAEGAGEGAVVVEAAGEGDLGDGLVGIAQEAGGGGDAAFGDVLAGGQAEEAFHEAGETMGRKAGTASQGGGCEGCRNIVLKVFEGGGEFYGNFAGFDGGANIAGHADEADDFAGGVSHGHFGGDAPAGFVWGVPVEFEVVEDGAAGFEEVGILGGGNLAEVAGGDVGRALAQDLRFVAQAMSFDEGIVYGQVPAGGVLNEESDVRIVIKEFLEQSRINLEGACWSGFDGLLVCAGFHNLQKL